MGLLGWWRLSPFVRAYFGSPRDEAGRRTAWTAFRILRRPKECASPAFWRFYVNHFLDHFSIFRRWVSGLIKKRCLQIVVASRQVETVAEYASKKTSRSVLSSHLSQTGSRQTTEGNLRKKARQLEEIPRSKQLCVIRSTMYVPHASTS